MPNGISKRNASSSTSPARARAPRAGRGRGSSRRGAALPERKPTPVAPLEIAAGVPADVLRRRPDIRTAERRLAAQTAEVGVATAALYPSLSLSGSITLQALTASDVPDGFRTDRLGLSLNLPIFRGAGR